MGHHPYARAGAPSRAGAGERAAQDARPRGRAGGCAGEDAEGTRASLRRLPARLGQSAAAGCEAAPPAARPPRGCYLLAATLRSSVRAGVPLFSAGFQA